MKKKDIEKLIKKDIREIIADEVEWFATWGLVIDKYVENNINKLMTRRICDLVAKQIKKILEEEQKSIVIAKGVIEPVGMGTTIGGEFVEDIFKIKGIDEELESKKVELIIREVK